VLVGTSNDPRRETRTLMWNVREWITVDDRLTEQYFELYHLSVEARNLHKRRWPLTSVEYPCSWGISTFPDVAVSRVHAFGFGLMSKTAGFLPTRLCV
jgi:hypothetical protein